MMNDILGGGGLPIAPKGAAVILPNTSPRPVGGIIKTLPEIAPSRATPETLLAKRTPTRIEQSPVSVTSRPSSVHRTSIQSKPSPHLELPISYSRQQVTPPSGRLTADHHLRQHSPIPTPRQPPMRIVPMSHSTVSRYRHSQSQVQSKLTATLAISSSILPASKWRNSSAS